MRLSRVAAALVFLALGILIFRAVASRAGLTAAPAPASEAAEFPSEPGPVDASTPLPPLPSGQSPRNPLQLWAVENEGSRHSATVEAAVQAASNFSAITASPITYAAFGAQMKDANPDTRRLAYVNATFSQASEANRYPDEWYAKDVEGRRIRSVGFGNWLMDPVHPDWIRDRVDTCATLLASSGYEGCFLDMLSVAPLHPGYASSIPVNPATNAAWAMNDWLQATTALAAEIRAGVAPSLVYGNGLDSGRRYFHPEAASSVLLEHLDGAVAESWLRRPSQPLDEYRPQEEWLQDVRMLEDAEQHGVPVLVLLKTWYDGQDNLKQQWHRFGLGSFLLGTGGQSAFAYRPDRDSSPTQWHPWWSIDLGEPLEPMQESEANFVRRFRNGIVVVNPTAAPADQTIEPGDYRTLDGDALGGGRLTVGPHDAVILVAQ